MREGTRYRSPVHHRTDVRDPDAYHSTLRAWGAKYPTARWQDKSRRLRLGRAAQECRHIMHLARGATAHDSLPIRITPCNFTTARTSRTAAP
jgi:hypothetical protein